MMALAALNIHSNLLHPLLPELSDPVAFYHSLQLLCIFDLVAVYEHDVRPNQRRACSVLP